MQIHGVGQISISVKDVDRAVEFYRDVLNIQLLFKVPGANPMAFFDCGGTRLYINQPENPEHAGNSIVYFKVNSAKDAANELKSKDVPIESEPHIIHQTENYELWMAFFRDPDGNLMAVMSEEGELMG